MKASHEIVRNCFEFGPFRLDPAGRTLFDGGRRVPLSPKAFDTLLVLIEHHGKVVGKEALMDLVWPGAAVEENNLAQSIAAIRKALGEQPGEHRYVATATGRGYAFVAPVTEATQEPQARHRTLNFRTGAFTTAVAVAGVLCVWLVLGQFAPHPRLMSLTGSTGYETAPTFSPDGRQIAYAWRPEGEEHANIWIKVIGAGDPLCLTRGRSASNPAWSPDGRYVAYWGKPSGIYMVPALGGAERKLADVKVFGRVAWFPDGKRLAIVDRDPETGFPCIFELAIDTGERRKLTSALSGLGGDHAPAVSPDGETLGFVRSASGLVNAAHLMPAAGGEPRQLTRWEEWALGFAWMPNGREIVYAAPALGYTSLWRIPVVGGTPRRVAEAGYDIAGVAIAPAGNRLAFTRRSGTTNLRRIDLDRPGSPRKLAPTNRIQKAAEFSPDGKRLAFESNRSGWGEIWTSDIEGGSLVQLTSVGPSGIFAGTPRWSPDGTEIAFDARPGGNPDIFVVNAQGGTPRRITSEPAADVAPSFSRDGRWIYFASNRTGSFQVWKAPRAGGNAVQITRRGGSAPMESADGKYLYYSTGNQGVTDLWRTAGGREEPVLEDTLWSWRAWTMTARGVVYVDAGGVLKLLDPTTGKRTTVATLPLVPPDFAVSPDGNTLIYSQPEHASSSIMLLENFR